jgi:hypothetical protein
MRGSYVVCRMPHVVLTATLMLWSAKFGKLYFGVPRCARMRVRL